MSVISSRRVHVATLIATLALLGAFSVLPALAAPSAEQQPRAVILLLEGLRLDEISPSDTPNLYDLFEQDASGLVALRKAFNYENVPSAFYATLGAGAPGAGLEGELRNAPRLLGPLTASDPRRGARARTIRDINTEHGARASFGALGTALRERGLKTAAIGSSSSSDFLNVVIDEKGRLDRLLLLDGVPTGVETARDTDVDEFTRLTGEIYRDSALTVAAFGDLLRLNPVDSGSAERARSRDEAVARADQVAGTLLEQVSPTDLLIVLMPFDDAAPDYGLKGNLISTGEPLSPIALRGPDHSGLLTSGTTRRTGTISGIDLAPTVLEHLGVDARGDLRGQPVGSTAYSKSKLKALQATADGAIAHDSYNIAAITMVIAYAVLVFFTVCVLILTGRARQRRLLRTLLLSLFLVPPAMSLPLLWGAPSLLVTLALVALVIALAVPLVFLFGDSSKPMLLVLGITAGGIVLDLLTGETLLTRSLLGNSLLSGGRYYGIGNQFLGFLFVFTVLFIVFLGQIRPAWLRSRAAKPLIAIVFFTVLMVAGSARFGANFGALVMLGVSLPFVFALIVGDSPEGRGRLSVLAGAFAAAMVVLSVIYDVLQLPGAQSHVARSLSWVSNAPAFALNLITTKLSKNLEEAFFVLISRGGLLFLSVLGSLVFDIRKELSASLGDFPIFKRVLPGIIAGAVIAFLINDTGIEPLLIILFYALAALLYLYLSVERVADPADASVKHVDNERMFA